MDFSIVTGVLVRRNDGKVLLVKKKDGVGPYAGTYLTPGGGVKTEEMSDDAVLRELYEETGIKTVNLQRHSFDEDITANWKGDIRHFVMLLYTAEYESGVLGATEGDDDHLENMDWFSPSEVEKLPLSPPLKRLLATIEVKNNKFEFVRILRL